MQKVTFLGHDNASLSMLIESLYCIYRSRFTLDIVTIMDSEQLDNFKVPYLIEGIEKMVLNHNEWLPEVDSFLILGTMVASIKIKIFNFFLEQYSLDHNPYQNIYHPQSVLSKTCKTGNGCSLGPGAVIAPFAKLGNHVSINRNATVGHHSTVSDFATLNPGCNIAGYCHIGKGATIGMGANIIDGKKIGNNTTIGAGALVTKDIPDNVIAYGIPAKVIRQKDS